MILGFGDSEYVGVPDKQNRNNNVQVNVQVNVPNGSNYGQPNVTYDAAQGQPQAGPQMTEEEARIAAWKAKVKSKNTQI